jgi:hypothetical protein
MDLGIPCNFKMLSMYNFANLSLPYVVHTGMKCASLVRKMIITHIESLPLGVLESPLIKSILMSSHFHSAMGNGWTHWVFDVPP